MPTASKREQTSLEEHETCEVLLKRFGELEEQLAEQRATGKEHKDTRTQRDNVLEKYQAARIAADRPRQA